MQGAVRDKVLRADFSAADPKIMRRTPRFAIQFVVSLALLCFAAPTFAAKEKSGAAKSSSTSDANVVLPAGADTLIWRGDHATGRTITWTSSAKEYAKEKKGRDHARAVLDLWSGLDAVAQGTADIAGSARGKYLERPEEAAGINFVPVDSASMRRS